MPVYDRSPPAECHVVDEWADGVGWQVHPDEAGARTSHAVRGDDGVWVLDPLDAPGVDDLLADLGEVTGVLVCSNWHARDAGALARRHDVAVHVPVWMTRVAARVDAPVERFDGTVGDPPFRVERVDPLPGWREGLLVRPADGTVYAPDLLTTADRLRVGDERVALTLAARPFPPRDLLGTLSPERILVGHGAGVHEDAEAALAEAIAGARRRFPRAALACGPSYLRGILGAVFG